jgi:hypothetical protein
MEFVGAAFQDMLQEAYSSSPLPSRPFEHTDIAILRGIIGDNISRAYADACGRV